MVLVAPFSLASGTELYRYLNEDGVLVVDYQVPTSLVKNGYEVINSKGQVLRVVPRQLTEEEQKAADIQKRQQAEALAEQKRQQEHDESLLMRYSTVSDIEAARERALGDLRIRVSILKSNKLALKQKVENYQVEAAEMERRGQEVDVKRLETIKDLQQQIVTADRAITDREKEISKVEAAYQEDIDRFKELEDMIEFRRTLAAKRREEREQDYDDPRR